MSHVSEGALHAYLDGALEELPSGEARAVREHVAACPECSARLEEEKLIREQAIAILGGGVTSVEMPPLEELKARAEALDANVPKKKGYRIHQLGWAASVVLAIGAGWTLRGGEAVPLIGVDPLDLPAPEVQAALPAALDVASELDEADRVLLEAVTSPASVGRDVVASAAMRTEADVSLDLVTTGVGTPSAEVVATTDALEQSRRQVGEIEFVAMDPIVTDGRRRIGLAEIAAEETVVFADLPAPTPSELEAKELIDLPARSFAPSGLLLTSPSLLTAQASSADETEPAERRERERLVVTSASRVSGGAGFVDDRSDEGEEDADARSRRVRGSVPDVVSVPGFELLSIESIDAGPMAGVWRMLQVLQPGDTLEALFLPEGLTPEDLPEGTGPGIEELRAERDGLWLVLRAPRSRVELEALLERLDANR